MNKFTGVFLPFLIVATFVPGFKSKSLGIPQKEQSRQEDILLYPRDIQGFLENKGVVQRIIDEFSDPPNPGGTTGDFVCSVVPAPKNPYVYQTWSLQPAFVWNGNVSLVSIFREGEEEVIWTYNSEDQQQPYVLANSIFLEPGTSYEVEFTDRDSGSPEHASSYRVSFRTLSNENIREINTDIEDINRRVEQENISSSLTNAELLHEQAFERADYFEKHPLGLWMDAVRELLSLDLSDIDVSSEDVNEMRLALLTPCNE